MIRSQIEPIHSLDIPIDARVNRLADRKPKTFELVNAQMLADIAQTSRVCLSCGAPTQPDGTLPCDH